MKIAGAVCLAIALAAATPATAQKIDLNSLTCKEFVDGPTEKISYILMWLAGYFMDEDDPPVIDFDAMKETAKKLGAYCAENPHASVMAAAEEVMGGEE